MAKQTKKELKNTTKDFFKEARLCPEYHEAKARVIRASLESPPPKQTKPIKQIIDLKELGRYLTKYYGKRCKYGAIGCTVCDVWDIFDQIELFYQDAKRCEKE